MTSRALLQRIPLRRWRTSAKAALLRRVPERFHAITDELAKFGTIGIINLIVNFAIFNLLWFTLLRSGEVKAKAVATIVATTCAYFLNRHWTYRNRPKSTLRREYTLFAFFNVVGLVIEVTVVAIAKYGFDQTHIVVLNIATAIGIAIGTVFRFWAYRTHVFKAPAIDTATELAVESEEHEKAAHEHAQAAGVRLSVNGLQLRTVVPDAVALDLDHDLDEEPATAVAPVSGSPDVESDEDRALQNELVQLELAEIVDRANQPVRR